MNPSDIGGRILELPVMVHVPEELRSGLAEVIRSVSKPRKVPKGGIWIREGEPSENKGYVLLDGAVVIRKSDAPEAVCHAPELLGETMQFSTGGVRTATVAAAENCIVLRFLWDDFWSAVAKAFPADAQETIRAAVQTLAWAHFAG